MNDAFSSSLSPWISTTTVDLRFGWKDKAGCSLDRTLTKIYVRTNRVHVDTATAGQGETDCTAKTVLYAGALAHVHRHHTTTKQCGRYSLRRFDQDNGIGWQHQHRTKRSEPKLADTKANTQKKSRTLSASWTLVNKSGAHVWNVKHSVHCGKLEGRKNVKQEALWGRLSMRPRSRQKQLLESHCSIARVGGQHWYST